MILSIKVKPNAKQDKMAFSEEGMLCVWIKAQPIDGKANKYLIGYFSSVFKLPKSAFEIVGGESNSLKRIKIELPENEVFQLIKSEIASRA